MKRLPKQPQLNIIYFLTQCLRCSQLINSINHSHPFINTHIHPSTAFNRVYWIRLVGVEVGKFHLQCKKNYTTRAAAWNTFYNSWSVDKNRITLPNKSTSASGRSSSRQRSINSIQRYDQNVTHQK